MATVRIVPASSAPALSETARRYPLATQTGVNLLVRILAADQHWRPLTTRQRDALRRAFADLITRATRIDPATVPADGIALELPALPADVHPATVRSLERRGLAADGHLTALAVEIVQWGDRDPRPITTTPTTGGHL